MNNKKLLKLNNFINKSYECFSFTEFLKLTILNLHELVMYDSGMFYCGISKDCSFFKPYIGGQIETYYRKQRFNESEEYLSSSENSSTENQAYVYKSTDYLNEVIQIANEPRSSFLSSQNDFYIACIRIVYKGQFMGEIYLHRFKDNPDFDDEDMFTLSIMQPHVSTVFNIIHTVTAVKYLETSNIPGSGIGICSFDRDMCLTGGNFIGVEMLKTATVFGSSVLYHLKEMCADILGDSGTGNSSNAVVCTELIRTQNGDIRVEIFFNNSRKPNNELKYIAAMQYCDKAQSINDYKFKFTKREADIIDGLIQGRNNIQLADLLSISENTIKTHIKSIYKKTGANNRAELTYVLMLNR